ncbi:MAG TPA: hypothetical protein VGJ14_11260, partial [Sporichthyaceae bacterium]
MNTERLIDPDATTLLTELRDMRWTWRREDLTTTAQTLRWTTSRSSSGASVKAPSRVSGRQHPHDLV